MKDEWSMAYRRPSIVRLSPIWVLIVVNIIIFILTTIDSELINVLALNAINVFHFPWTMVTSMFVHLGPWHLIFNMWTLYFFGTYLSRLVGWGRFFIVYFCGGILGGVFYILMASPFTWVAGASGAIFALGGAMAVMRPNIKVIVFPIPAPIPLWIAVIGGFVILTLLSNSMNIAWQAHMGGLVFGLIMGYFFRRRERSSSYYSVYRVRY